MIFLGDVHGNIKLCNKIAYRNPTKTIIQVGDLGVGFVKLKVIDELPDNFYFLVGNHDSRTEANKSTKCLGDFGQFKNIFFISGADSIDKNQRIEGVSWWRNEELTIAQGLEAIDQWENSDAEILVSHDVPQSFAEKFLSIHEKSITRNILQAVFEVRKPKLWIAGHHHKSIIANYLGTDFRILNINEVLEVDGL